jgi:hypothetical protein
MNELCHVTSSLPSTPAHPCSIRLVTSTYWVYWLLEDQKKKGERVEKRREKKECYNS